MRLSCCVIFYSICILLFSLTIQALEPSAVSFSNTDDIEQLQTYAKSDPHSFIQDYESGHIVMPDDWQVRHLLHHDAAFSLLVMADYQLGERWLRHWLELALPEHRALTSRTLELLAAIEIRTGNSSNAYQLLEEAYAIALEFNQPERVTTNLIYQAVLYLHLQQLQVAHEKIELALSRINQFAQWNLYPVAMSNYATILTALEQPKDVISMLYEAMQHPAYQEADRAYTHIMLARNYLLQQQADKASYYAGLALPVYQNRRDPYQMTIVYQLLGEAASLQNQFEAASSYFLSAHELAERHHFKDRMQQILLHQSRLMEKEQRLPEAIQLLRQHSDAYKSHHRHLAQEQVSYLKQQQQNLQRQQERLTIETRLQQQQKKQEQRQQLVILLIIFLLCLTVLFWYFLFYLGKKRQASEQLSTELQAAYEQLQSTQLSLIQSEKIAASVTLIAGVVAAVKPALAELKQMIPPMSDHFKQLEQQLYDKSLTKTELLATIDHLNSSLETGHQHLDSCITLINRSKQLAIAQYHEPQWVSLKDKAAAVIESLHSKHSESVQIDCQFPDVMIWTDPHLLHLVLYELMLNSLEHGFNEQQQGLISLRAYPQNDDFILQIEDNGQGSAEAPDKILQPFISTSTQQTHAGLGLNVVKNIVRQAWQGELTISQTSPGFRVDIKLAASLCKAWDNG